MLPSGHALAGQSCLTPADFEGLPFVSLAPADPYRQRIDQAFADAGVARQLRVESASAASVCALVAAGLGVALVNPVTALAMAGHGLVLRPFSVPIVFNVNLVLPQWRAVHPLREALTAALQSTAGRVQQQLDALTGPETTKPALASHGRVSVA